MSADPIVDELDACKQQINKLQRQNYSLGTLVVSMIHAGDAIFSSRAWHLGCTIVDAERPWRRLIRRRREHTYLRSDSFYRLAAANAAFQEFQDLRQKLESSDKPVDIDVKTVMSELWEALGREYNRDAD
jgi:hypothetical protein